MSHSDVGLGVAVIGAGLMGHWHAHYAKRNGATILAIVDPDADAAGRLARIHGATSFGHTAEMLEKASPHVVHVCTPLPTHHWIALAALEYGTHVIVEKPFADTAERTRIVLDYAREKELLAVPVHQFAFQRGVRQVLTSFPLLGEPLRLKFRICSAGGESMDDAGRDALLADILPHPLSVLQRLWPGETAAHEDWHAVSIRHGELDACGRWGTVAVDLTVSLSARPPCCEADLEGTGGTVRLDFFHGFAAIRRGAVTRTGKVLRPFREAGGLAMAASANLVRRALEQEPAYPGLSALIGRVYAAARGDSPPPFSDEEILRTAEMRDHLAARADLIPR